MASMKHIMFLACGSFSPPTPMHLRMFEIARDHFRGKHKYEVIGGVISPVHDLYSKTGLVAAHHRCTMVKLALQTSDWIRLSDWECVDQEEWTRTRVSLQYHQNYINSILNDTNGTVNELLPGWIPENIKTYQGKRVQVKLLCGADLLESFSVPGLWNDDDLEAILGEHGLVVITRSGSNPEKFIFESDLLTKYRKNITIVTNWVPNEVSSTMARRHLSRGLSVKYMLDDVVVDYIRQNCLFGASETKYLLTPNQNQMISTSPLSPGFINDSYIKKINITNYNYDLMDETDNSSKKSLISDADGRSNGRPKALCCTGNSSGGGGGGGGIGGLNASMKNFMNSRPGQAVQIRTDVNGTRTIDHEDEVGECKISTITLSPENRALEKKIEYLSDNQLDKIANGVSNGTLNDDTSNDGDTSLENLSVECLPTTSKRNQNDLIQFVFTSHGIRVISDKEYVV